MTTLAGPSPSQRMAASCGDRSASSTTAVKLALVTCASTNTIDSSWQQLGTDIDGEAAGDVSG